MPVRRNGDGRRACRRPWAFRCPARESAVRGPCPKASSIAELESMKGGSARFCVIQFEFQRRPQEEEHAKQQV